MTDHPLKYEVVICWSEDDHAFVAEVPALPGCAGRKTKPAEFVIVSVAITLVAVPEPFDATTWYRPALLPVTLFRVKVG